MTGYLWKRKLVVPGTFLAVVPPLGEGWMPPCAIHVDRPRTFQTSPHKIRQTGTTRPSKRYFSVHVCSVGDHHHFLPDVVLHATTNREENDQFDTHSGDHSISKSSSPVVDQEEEEPPNEDSSILSTNAASTTTPSFPILPAAVATLALVLFWPLLAFFRSAVFDVDMFMALKGILDERPAGYDYGGDSNIVELPPLSPAERLVDAIFGPP